MTGLPLRLSSSHLLNFCTDSSQAGKAWPVTGCAEVGGGTGGSRVGVLLQSQLLGTRVACQCHTTETLR